MKHDVDILVIGSGIAGLTFALKAARHGSVLLVTKKERADANTNYARGGVAAVLGDDDRPDLHIQDTLVAGAGLCHRDVVEVLVGEGPERIRELAGWGTRFDEKDGRLSLGREGGHSRRRIVHSGDHTGRTIETALLEAVEAEKNITVLEDHLAVDFLLGPDPTTRRPLCRGILALDHDVGRLVTVRARVTFLASGGCGHVYRHTTNPAIATGDGTAMAYRAGALIANMEFIQFHPTALYPTEDPAFLISEAVRGEGAVLRTLDGRAFMDGAHPMASLAPRDVVARSIDSELRRTGDSHVILDPSTIPAADFASRFPATVEGLRDRGIDPHHHGIPVVPAAHYACGGVRTDLYARTSIPALYAAGEVACTGVHGANRLASNSLLEAVVFSHRASRAVEEVLRGPAPPFGDEWLPGGVALESALGQSVASVEEDPAVVRDRTTVRHLMWESVGIVRSDPQLEDAAHRLAALTAENEADWQEGTWTPDRIELRNLLQTAELIVACARLRRESRGLHNTVDHPYRDNERYLRDTVVGLRSAEVPFPGTAQVP